MRFLRALLLVFLGLGAAAVLAWWLFSGWIVEQGRRLAEDTLAQALDAPVRIPVLTLSLAPPVLHTEGVAIGKDGAAVRVAHATLRFLPYTSLRQVRPVGELEAGGVWVDLTALPATAAPPAEEPPPEEEAAGPLFPFRLRRVHVTDLQVRAAGEGAPLDLSGAELTGDLTVSPVTRHLRLALTLQDLRVQRGDETLRLDRIRVAGGQTWRGLEVKELLIRGDGVEVTAAPREGLALRHSLGAEIALDRLRVLGGPLTRLGGLVRLDATLTGPLEDPGVEAAVRGERLSVDGQAVGSVRADIKRQADLVEVKSGRLQGFGGELTFAGRIGFSEAMPFHLDAAWSEIDGVQVGALIGIGVAPLAAKGQVTATGSVAPLSFAGQIAGELAPRDGGGALTLTAEGRYGRAGGRAELSLRQGEINSLGAAVTVGAKEELSGEVRLRITDTNALRSFLQPVELPPLTGSLEATGQLSGTRARPAFSGQLTGQNVEALGVVVERVDGALTADTNRIHTDGLALAVGGGTVTVAGTVALAAAVENAWEARIEKVATDFFATVVRTAAGTESPLTGGTVTATLSGRGPWSQPVAQGELTVEGFRLWGEPFEGFTLNAAATWPGWKGEAQLVHSQAERLAAKFSGSEAKEIQASLQGENWSLNRLRGAELSGLSGTVSLSVAVEGPVGALDGRVEAAGTDVILGGRRLGRVALGAEAERGNWQLDGSLAETIRLRGRLLNQAGFPFSLDAHWTETEIAPLLLAEPDLQVWTVGGVDVRGRLDQVERMDGDLRLETLRIEQGPYRVQAPDPVVVRIRQGAFVIESLALEGTRTQLRVSGGGSAAGDVRLSLSGQADLRLVELVGEPIRSARGGARMRVEFARSERGEIDVDGEVSLNNAALDFGLPLVLSETNGRLSLENQQVQIEALSGKTGGGSFSVGGTVDLAEGPAVTWSVTEISTGFLPWLEEEVSGSGAVRGRWEDFTVAGEVEVLRVLYDRRISLTDFLPWFQRTVASPPAQEPSGGIVRLDLHVLAPDEIFIDNNFAKMELRADLRVGGTAEDVRLAGPIEVLSGQVLFRDRTFDITTGVIEFRPVLGLNPYLNIIAETVVPTPDASYAVTIQISGTADDYRVLLSSDDPALSQNDLLSLVTLGKTPAQLQQGGGGVSVGDLLALAPGLYQEQVEEGVEELLPVDRVEIEPAFSRTTGTFEPRVTIGKDFTEDLSALVSTSFGVEPTRTVQLEYRLTPRISLLGSWESQTETQSGAFGGDVKFRHEFRHFPGYSLLAPWRGWDDELR